MLSLTLLTLALLQDVALGNPLGSAPAPAPLAGRAQCNANNCLRVMTDTLTVASSFCSTWLQPTSYTTVTPTVYASSKITDSILLMLG
jgi:hypothetical protein